MKDKKKNTFLMILFIFLMFGGIIRLAPASYSASNDKILLVERYPYIDNNDVNEMFDLFDKQVREFFNESRNLQRKLYKQQPFGSSNFSSVKTEETEKEYKITLDLKKFGNDEKNVNFELKNNTVTISAKYENRGQENYYNSSSFYKSFSLPSKVDANNVKKIIENNKLIFIIPKLEGNLPKNTTPKKQAPDFKFDEYNGNFI